MPAKDWRPSWLKPGPDLNCMLTAHADACTKPVCLALMYAFLQLCHDWLGAASLPFDTADICHWQVLKAIYQGRDAVLWLQVSPLTFQHHHQIPQPHDGMLRL